MEPLKRRIGQAMGRGKAFGLFMIFTGKGKGKTTSAIGLALKAAGHGMKTAFGQKGEINGHSSHI